MNLGILVADDHCPAQVSTLHGGSASKLAQSEVSEGMETKNADFEAVAADISIKEAQAIDPDPQRVLCPPRIPFPQLLQFEMFVGWPLLAVMVPGNLVVFIYVLSTTPEIWLGSLSLADTSILMSSMTSVSIFLVHKLAGRFRLEGLRSDDQVPAAEKVFPLILFSHEPLTTWGLVILVPIFYLFLEFCIISGVWTCTLTPGLPFTIFVMVTVFVFMMQTLGELHHLTQEEKRVQPAACWAFVTFLIVWGNAFPVSIWWTVARFECDHCALGAAS
eukprot:s644_g20.t1